MVRQWAGALPPHSVGQSSRRGKDQARRSLRSCLGGASLPRRSGRPLGVGFCAVPPMAALASPSRRQPQASALQAASIAARDALVLQHLPLADAIASVMARRLFPLVERDDLIQVAREALLRSLPRCKPGEPADHTRHGLEPEEESHAMPVQECAETPRTGGDSRRMEPVPPYQTRRSISARVRRDAVDRERECAERCTGSVAADGKRASSGEV